MRFYTYGVGAQLVLELEMAGAVERIVHDGADIIQLKLVGGQSLMVHLIDSGIPLYEIKHTLNANTAAGHHTLFILWSDMLLPDHATPVLLKDWHRGLMALSGGCIYAYKVYMEKLTIFPIYFDPYGLRHITRFGAALDVGALRCGVAKPRLHGLTGTWYVATFTGDPEAYHRQWAAGATGALAEHYALLQVEPGVDKTALKAAYRRLARLYHPDVNATDDAHQRMQAINRAYAVLLQEIEKNDYNHST